MAFVVFEGLDGSGKSTLIKKLKAHLEDSGVQVVLSHEPGGTELAEQIRHLILKTEGEAPVSMTELLLYEASRAQHVETLIKPNLEAKKWVLCDRYTGSTLAFQCGGRGIDRSVVDQLNQFATQGLKPDLWVLLDLSLEESERRRKARGEEEDRLESEAADFHQRVRDYYLKLAEEDPKTWVVLNAEKPVDDLFETLLKELSERGHV